MNLTDTPNAGEYGVVYADPPWRFNVRSVGERGHNRTPDAHYPTLTLAEIKALPVADVVARNCHLFMWTTGPHLEQSFEVLRAWGFKYSTVGFVWVKLTRGQDKAQFRLFTWDDADFHVGMGYTTRSNAEFCLLGRRGSPPRLSKAVRQLIVDPVREHSRKPDEARRRILAYAPGPRLEMFARERVVGFDAWGNEIEKFGGRPRRLVRAGA